MMFWDTKKQPSTEAEFDIEGIDVYGVGRSGNGDTLISYRRGEMECEWVCASTDEQHRSFVERLTKKIASAVPPKRK